MILSPLTSHRFITFGFSIIPRQKTWFGTHVPLAPGLYFESSLPGFISHCTLTCSGWTLTVSVWTFTDLHRGFAGFDPALLSSPISSISSTLYFLGPITGRLSSSPQAFWGSYIGRTQASALLPIQFILLSHTPYISHTIWDFASLLPLVLLARTSLIIFHLDQCVAYQV